MLVDAPKDTPKDVVADVLTALVEDKEDVYPASAAPIYDAWRENQKAVEAGWQAWFS